MSILSEAYYNNFLNKFIGIYLMSQSINIEKEIDWHYDKTGNILFSNPAVIYELQVFQNALSTLTYYFQQHPNQILNSTQGKFYINIVELEKALSNFNFAAVKSHPNFIPNPYIDILERMQLDLKKEAQFQRRMQIFKEAKKQKHYSKLFSLFRFKPRQERIVNSAELRKNKVT